MNTHDIELPTLPDWADRTLEGEDRASLFAWAEAAIEADRKRQGDAAKVLAELVALIPLADTLNASASCQDLIDYFKGVIADSQRRGEPVDESQRVYLHDEGRPEYLDGARCKYVIERGKPYPLGGTVAFVYEKEDAERIVAALNNEPCRGELVLVGWAVSTTGKGMLPASKYTEYEARCAGYSLPLYRLTAPQPAESSRGKAVAWRTYDRNGWYVISPTLEEAERDFPGKDHQPLYAAPQPAEPVAPEFLADLKRSRAKYPGNASMFDGLMGELDELRRAYAGDGDIRAEAFDVAVCAYRIATEGDAGGNSRLTQPAAGFRTVGEIRLDANRHPYACLLTGYDEHGDQWKEGTPIYAATQPADPVSQHPDDAAVDALSNLEHDNYEQSYSGYKNRQADIALIRAALARAALASYGQPAESVKVSSDADAKHVQDFINCDGMGAVIVEGPQYSAVVRALLAEPVKSRFTTDPTDYINTLRNERDALANAARAAGYSFLKYADGSVRMVPQIKGVAQSEDAQPAEPVKVPSDDEIIELRSEFDWREHYGNIRFARALLAHYGQPAEPVKVPKG